MMLPLVTLQLTATLAESPVLMNPTAVKSAVVFGCRMRVFGETRKLARILPVVPVARGFSQANSTPPANATATIVTMRSLSSASRHDSLCLNVIRVSPLAWCALRREEFAHVGCCSCATREHRHPEPLEDQAQRALMLIRSGRLIARLRFGADRRPEDPSAAQRVVTAGLVEHDDQEAVLLEHRVSEQRSDVRLEPVVRGDRK